MPTDPFYLSQRWRKLRAAILKRDGYIRYIWSFGNSGKNYMFAKDLEPLKHEAHDFVVFGRRTEHFNMVEPFVKSKDIHRRRIEFCVACKKLQKRFDLQQLEQLERLQQLERLERRITVHCGSYADYEYRDGASGCSCRKRENYGSITSSGWHEGF